MYRLYVNGEKGWGLLTTTYDPFILMTSLDHLILQRHYDKILLVIYHDEKINCDNVDYRYSNIDDDYQAKYELYRKRLITRYVKECENFDNEAIKRV